MNTKPTIKPAPEKPTCNECGKLKPDCECFDACIECEAFAEDGNIKHKTSCSFYIRPKPAAREPAARKPATRTKDLKAPTDKEIGRIAVDLFNGKTTMTKTAKALGISTSYLSRLIKGAEKRGAFRYAVARS